MAEDYDAKIGRLEDALASGELTVESDGDRVTYRSVSDLRQAIEILKDRQREAAAPGRRSMTTVAAYSPD